SNSLLEAVVFSARIAEALAREPLADAPADWSEGSRESGRLQPRPDSDQMKRLRHEMSAHLGVLREGKGMRDALRTIMDLEREADTERFHNVLTAAKLITVCALLRKESRGGHFRTDYPREQEAWRHRTFVTLAEAEAAIPALLKEE
ncbi:MAG: L-aspartate oxidase, partial [Oricola sp.]